jgi:hypothetical protein
MTELGFDKISSFFLKSKSFDTKKGIWAGMLNPFNSLTKA